MDLEKLLHKQTNAPLILGGGINALGLARSLGEAGIFSIITETKKNFSFSSRYVSGIVCPNPYNENAFVDFLINFGKKLSSKCVLFATNDKWLIPISKNRHLLEKYFLYPMSEHQVIDNCSNKKKMYSIAQIEGIAYPKTFYLDCITELYSIIKDISYPCILKPGVTLEFEEKLNSGARIISIKNKEELEEWYKKIVAAEFLNREIVIQEYIPGGIENLYTITTYSNPEAEIICYSTGHKLRQRPPDAGTIISGRVIPKPELFKPAQKLIKAYNFYGIANTEFKYDSRDNTYKLMEINPRPGKWNYSAMASGINMPLIAWQQVLNKEITTLKSSDKELVWICFLEDFYNSVLGGFKRKGYKDFSLSLFEYLKSIKGKKVEAVFSLKDIKPAIKYLFSR